MKRNLVLCIIILALVKFLNAGVWKDKKIYNEYKQTKQEAIIADAEGNTYSAVKNFLKCYELAKDEGIGYIEAWMLNNAGYALIKKYKKTHEKTLLNEALGYFKKAKELDIKEAEKTIENNINYCLNNL